MQLFLISLKQKRNDNQDKQTFRTIEQIPEFKTASNSGIGAERYGWRRM